MWRIRILFLATVLALVAGSSAYAGSFEFQSGTGINEAYLVPGRTGNYSDDGGFSLRKQRAYVGTGWKVVDVRLRGWELYFLQSDHHINVHKVWIENVQYSPSNGWVSFDIQITYADKNFDDDYGMEVFYAVLALR